MALAVLTELDRRQASQAPSYVIVGRVFWRNGEICECGANIHAATKVEQQQREGNVHSLWLSRKRELVAWRLVRASWIYVTTSS